MLVAASALATGWPQGTNQGDPQNGNGGVFGSSGASSARIQSQTVPVAGAEERFAKGKPVQLLGDRATRAIRVLGSDVTISGNSNRIRIMGTARSVTITGNQNQVTIDRGDQLSISGSKNAVMIAITRSVAASGSGNKVVVSKRPRPRVSSGGSGNQIILPKR